MLILSGATDPMVPQDNVARLAALLSAAGASVLTTCETDDGRARRDRGILEKHGARDVFTYKRPLEDDSRQS